MERFFRPRFDSRSRCIFTTAAICRYILVCFDCESLSLTPLDLHRVIMAPLEQSILHGAHAPFDTLFELYANIAQRWIGNLENNPIQKQAYDDLAQHVSILAQSALINSQASAAAILSFYERTADATSHSIIAGRYYLPLCLLPPSLLYLLTMTPSLNILARVCALLTTYKVALEMQIKLTTSFHADSTRTLNGYLMDICNLLWRSRALTTSDANSFGCLCPDDVGSELLRYVSHINRDYALPKFFDFSHNPLLSSLSWRSFAALEAAAEGEDGATLLNHAGPVTQQSLVVLGNEGGMSITWKQYRVQMLHWLEERGVDGFRKLMFATMKDLMK
jgi:centromere protein I